MRGINKRVTSSFVFTAAPCSFAVVLIPEEPIYSEVARVSLEIAKKYGSKNIIDNLRFPTHATIIISGTTPEHLSSIVDKISSLKISIDTQAKAVGVYVDTQGFVYVKLQGNFLTTIHEGVASIVAAELQKEVVVRSRVQKWWQELSAVERKYVQIYGSYRVKELFKPHISIAFVEPKYSLESLGIAKKLIILPQTIRFSQLQIVDIGEEDEMWDVVAKRSL
jgi:hypothetical protein